MRSEINSNRPAFGVREALAASALAAALALVCASASAQTTKPSFEYKPPATIAVPGNLSTATNGAAGPVGF